MVVNYNVIKHVQRRGTLAFPSKSEAKCVCLDAFGSNTSFFYHQLLEWSAWCIQGADFRLAFQMSVTVPEELHLFLRKD